MQTSTSITMCVGLITGTPYISVGWYSSNCPIPESGKVKKNDDTIQTTMRASMHKKICIFWFLSNYKNIECFPSSKWNNTLW